MNKGYQTTDTATSTVTTKVKGLGYIQYGNTRESFPLKQARVFDTSDYIVPPNEYNSVFIMSNFIETIQTQGHCDEVGQKTEKRNDSVAAEFFFFSQKKSLKIR